MQLSSQNLCDALSGAAMGADAPLVLDVSETARLLGLSKMTVYRRIRSGNWPCGRSGRKWLVSNDFVHALAAELRSGRQVVVEEFAAIWMAQAPAVPPAGEGGA